jgi:hypothetical protein
MNPEEVEAAVRLWLDTEAIKKLKATYCYLCDERRFEEVIDLFTEDARLDFGGVYYEGRQGMEAFFIQLLPAQLSFSMHMVHNPIVEVDGDTAKGKWYFEAPTTFKPDNKAFWLAGIYEEEYVRNGAEWKIASLKAIFHYTAPYEQGWALPQQPGPA